MKLECLGLNLLLVVLNLFMPSFLRMKNGDNDSSNLIGLLRKLNELILSACGLGIHLEQFSKTESHKKRSGDFVSY